MDGYPLMISAGETLRAASGRPLSEIDLERAVAGELSVDDLRITGDTLRAQARIAVEAGYAQVAANLRRAAELAVVPNDELLRMYELLRPGRASAAELAALATRLESAYRASETAGLVREAAQAYSKRHLLRREAAE